MSNRMGGTELLDLEPTVINVDEVKGGMFLPARFPFKSSTNPTESFPIQEDPVLSITRVDPS